MSRKTKFNQLKDLYAILLGPKGCLWDRKQTHRSLIPYLKEETGEFIAAVRKNNPAHMQEELGDILLQVMFHSELARREQRFDIEDVIDTLIKKLKRRHPHVFGNTKARSTRQIKANWAKIKLMEKLNRKNT
ncbi:MAG: MazG nucleotide pyrophosphohydrolase domain-containing protein [Candidatus Omnitrophica bacterium]|nr:MazG nucleotide pyrophosphohydrolase domain-containing protein [Candidatus Omnitrophota bacterium]MDD5513582.1 MazG nucleotide pyrophosphohydrolase domain-containing protein [Candidatus Omnitrophota bacterium]